MHEILQHRQLGLDQLRFPRELLALAGVLQQLLAVLDDLLLDAAEIGDRDLGVRCGGRQAKAEQRQGSGADAVHATSFLSL